MSIIPTVPPQPSPDFSQITVKGETILAGHHRAAAAAVLKKPVDLFDVDTGKVRRVLITLNKPGTKIKTTAIHTAFGFSLGNQVRLKVPTLGGDEHGDERAYPVGAKGEIAAIHQYGPIQGIAFDVVVEGEIVNTFDEGDGPIANFIEHAVEIV